MWTDRSRITYNFFLQFFIYPIEIINSTKFCVKNLTVMIMIRRKISQIL